MFARAAMLRSASRVADPDDDALLEAWRDGDAEAGRTLVARHFAGVYGFFATKLDADVDDLLQQTFLAVVEARDRVTTSFRAYLFGIARNQLMRHFRDVRPGDESVGRLPAPATSIAEVLARRREQKLLLQALRRLPLDLQIAVELSYFEGLSDRELATVLAMPVGTLKSRLRKARGLLAAAMTELANNSPRRGEWANADELLESTSTGFDRWMASIRAAFAEVARDRAR
jgi:RNA polymerase sigma factor (sigma-70 family)